jgi:hypothetical protein
MKVNGWVVVIAATTTAMLVAAGAAAQVADGARSVGVVAEEQALASIRADRAGAVRQILERWRSHLGPADPANNDDGGLAELAGALHRATPERLLAASRAESYDEVRGLLARREEPAVIALEPGQAVPNTLGSTSGDLVFTPITPCRILDTRFATGAFAGKVGPNAGNWFSVNLANFGVQGGASSCPGISSLFDVSAVAINVTSTGQTGVGNLRLVECGGALPLVSLLNYTPGVNLANAAVVRSAIGCTLGPGGSNDLFVYSQNAASDVVVDLMGYYAAPVSTALECGTASTTISLSAGVGQTAAGFTSCPPGYALTGAGAYEPSGSPANSIIVNKLDLQSGQVFCRLTNNTASAVTAECQARCCRVPGL